MAELKLTRTDADSGRLPRLCMQCGAPAADEIHKKYSTDQTDFVPPPDEPVGCLIIWPILGVLKLISWSVAKTMTVRTPLCHKHAHGWFAWSTLEAKAICDDSILLTGVSDQFVQAWEKQRETEVRRAPSVVKVRCRSCQSLNDEAAKFCNQCGAAL